MPASFIIIVEAATSSTYTNVHAQVKTYGSWARITKSTWVVASEKTQNHIRDHLADIIEEGDRLFIVRSGTAAAWINVRCRDEWLKKHL